MIHSLEFTYSSSINGKYDDALLLFEQMQCAGAPIVLPFLFFLIIRSQKNIDMAAELLK
jgi:hypothetical protein